MTPSPPDQPATASTLCGHDSAEADIQPTARDARRVAEHWSAAIACPHLSHDATYLPGHPLKLGVLASGSGSNFEAVAQAIAQGQLNARIQVLIYNNPTAKAAVRADRWQIPARLLNHREFPSREDLDQQIVQTLRQFEVEWVVMAGWMRRVTQVLIDAFPRRILNIHPSLLPSFRGLHAVEQALAYGVRISGCTVHFVELEVDAGPIIQQAAVPVLPEDTPESLHARIQEQEHKILPQAIALAAGGHQHDNAHLDLSR